MNTYDGTFVLTIVMGNDAMKTRQDIMEQLGDVAKRIALGHEYGSILDMNGNNVGGFALPPANTEEK